MATVKTDLEIFIHKHLLNEGWNESLFGVISANMPDGGSCNLTYIIADVVRAYNKSLIESLGEPLNHNEYDIEPNQGQTEWWINHRHIGSGEPLEQFLNSEPII